MNKIIFPTKLYLPKYSGESLWKVNQSFKRDIDSMNIYNYVDGNFWADIFIKYRSRLSQRILTIRAIQNAKNNN